jgi:hypothetical protein
MPAPSASRANATCNANTGNGTTAITTPALSPSHPLAAINAAEQANLYQAFGPGYVGTGIVGDLSLELGITTGEGENCQRSGVGFYLRSDHMAHRYASQLLI